MFLDFLSILPFPGLGGSVLSDLAVLGIRRTAASASVIYIGGVTRWDERNYFRIGFIIIIANLITIFRLNNPRREGKVYERLVQNSFEMRGRSRVNKNSRRTPARRTAKKELYSNQKRVDPNEYLDLITGSRPGYCGDVSLDVLNKIHTVDLFSKSHDYDDGDHSMDEGVLWDIQMESVCEGSERFGEKRRETKKRQEKEKMMFINGKCPKLTPEERRAYDAKNKEAVDRVRRGFDEEGLKQLVMAKRGVYQKTIEPETGAEENRRRRTDFRT